MTYINPQDLYNESLDSFHDLWDDYSTLWDNFSNIFNRSVLLPHHEIQAPIFIAYSLCNQKWSKTLPVLFLYGKEGSGKSQAIKLNANLHDSTIFGADCTFASIRNELNKMKWLDYEEGREMHRDGALLLFDNVYPQTFLNDEKLLSMILRSYEAQNDTVVIAGAAGENYTFKTFTSKIISSVQPFSGIHKLRELNRRMITIRTKQLKEMTSDELTTQVDGDILDLDSINFDGMNFKYVQFWSDASNCARYVQTRQLLARSNGVAQRYLKASMSEEKVKIVIDLIVTAVITGGFASLESAIDAFALHFKLNENAAKADRLTSVVHFEQFINQWLILKGSGNTAIPYSEIKTVADELNASWGAERTIKQREVSEIMIELGWVQDARSKTWVQISQ